MRCLTLCVVLLAIASGARAEATYEWARMVKLLAKEGLVLDPQPEGKRIAWVRVVRDDIFVEDEKWPVWFNRFHKLTRDRVVRRELLFFPGENYHQKLVEETMRNLRSMGIFALARIVAVHTDDPRSVGVVVQTRDVWSLRAEVDGSLDRQINRFGLTLVERNLAGMNADLAGGTLIVRDKITLSESVVMRRVHGSNLRLAQEQGIILGRLRPGVEGSLGSVRLSRPFYRLSQRYSWDVGGAYDARVARQLDANNQYITYELPGGQLVNGVFDDRQGLASANFGWRFGNELKMTLGGSFIYQERRTRPNGETDLPPGLDDAFRDMVLPLSRRDVGPRIYYDVFLARYRTTVNVATFGQTENVRVGPHAALSLYFPVQALGSTYDAMVVRGVLEGTTMLGSGLVTVGLDGTSRLQNGMLLDQRLLAQLRFVSPLLGPVRLVSRIALDARLRDSQRTYVTLGSNRGLRGFPANSFWGQGDSRILLNTELRTLPLKFRSVHVGGVLFYDMGSVYERLGAIDLHHAVGVGLRILFPQFNRYPFSVDAGYPLDPPFRFRLKLVTPTVNTAQSVPITDDELDNFP